MSIPDTLMSNYFTLLTDLPPEEIGTLLKGHPRDTKDRLARLVVEQFHDKQAAEAASEEFLRRFRDKQPARVTRIHSLKQNVWKVCELLVEIGFAKSNSEARRKMIKERAKVIIDGARKEDPYEQIVLDVGDDKLIEMGRRAVKVCFGPKL
jgi:tyrosyl-tRNA synthetase